MRPLRIDIQIPSLSVGGAESMTVEMANGFAARGHRVRVFAAQGANGDLGATLLPDIERIAIDSRAYSASTVLRSLTMHGASHCDVALYHLTPSLLAIAAQRIGSRTPSVFIEHGPRLDQPGNARDRIASALYRCASAVVCVSQNIRDDYVARVAPHVLDRTSVISNGVPVDRIATSVGAYNRSDARRALGLPVDAAIGAMIGRLAPVKGHSAFLTAWSALRNAGTHSGEWPHIAIVGDGPIRGELEALVAQLQLSDVVHFTGAVIPVAQALAAVDLVFMASHTEGQPMILLEAMASSLPIASVGVGGIPAMLGGAGSIVPPGQHDQLAREVLRILTLPADVRAQRGGQSLQRVRAGFDIATMVDRYLELCERLVTP
ncbi:MAG: glycosyltransferase family 4 protein [Gemmatimonas sp.]